MHRKRNEQIQRHYMKRILTQILLLLSVTAAIAQADYYKSIDGIKGGEPLKTALHKLIKNHQQISYGSGSSSTWGAFYTTDAVIENGKRRVLDMYSSEKRYFGSKGDAISDMNILYADNTVNVNGLSNSVKLIQPKLPNAFAKEKQLARRCVQFCFR